jgi:hypothetical protein
MTGARALTIGTAVLALGLTSVATPGAAGTERTAKAPVNYREWRTDFGEGKAEGTQQGRRGLTVGTPIGTEEHARPDGRQVRYDFARWTSPVHAQGFGATELVASWNADTPRGTWIKVEMSGRTSRGTATKWYVLGNWASGDTDIRPTSVNDQGDANGTVNTDTFASAEGVTLSSYRLRVTLYRAAGSGATPTLRMAGAMTSNIPDRSGVPTSPQSGAWGKELHVPRYSQNVHAGQYPQYGGGGENWCSPTSTEMVVEYWRRGPGRRALSWIDPGIADPSVVHAARHTFDYAYDGTGNWPFNTAYAASFGLDAHVTRLHSLADVEHYISAGVPVITSQSFEKSELGYGTDGHIFVIVGFTKTGDVIVNDPASASDAVVRTVYPRAMFEDVWLRTKRVDEDGKPASGSGGIAYIIQPPGPRSGERR